MYLREMKKKSAGVMEALVGGEIWDSTNTTR